MHIPTRLKYELLRIMDAPDLVKIALICDVWFWIVLVELLKSRLYVL